MVDIATVLFFQFGLFDVGARVLGQCRRIEFFKGLDGAGIAQTQRFVRTEVAGLGQAGGGDQQGGGKQGSQLVHDRFLIGWMLRFSEDSLASLAEFKLKIRPRAWRNAVLALL